MVIWGMVYGIVLTTLHFYLDNLPKFIGWSMLIIPEEKHIQNWIISICTCYDFSWFIMIYLYKVVPPVDSVQLVNKTPITHYGFCGDISIQ